MTLDLYGNPYAPEVEAALVAFFAALEPAVHQARIEEVLAEIGRDPDIAVGHCGSYT